MQYAREVREFIRHHFRHFNAAVVVDAAESFRQFVESGNKMLVAMAGAMSTAELGISLAEMIRQGKVHAISCTGANLEEDIYNLVAHDFYVRVPHWRSLTADDEVALWKRHLNRVTDTCIPEEEAIRRIEGAVMEEWLAADRNGESYFPHEFFYRVLRSGKLDKYFQIDPRDSWVYAAMEANLPIFVPGWEDSTTGNIYAAHCIAGDIKNVHTVKGGIQYMMELAQWYKKQTQDGTKVGFFQIGGGIAGDFAICAVPMMRQDCSGKTFHFGGISAKFPTHHKLRILLGGSAQRENDMGKLGPDTPRFIIESDATIVAPLIFAYVLG
jgi:deoxyhypusine synthase